MLFCWYQVRNNFLSKYTFFYKKKVYKKMRLKRPKSLENPKKITRLKFKKILRKLQLIFFTCQKLILAHFCKLSYKDRELWWPNKYRVACFHQFVPAKVKKILRKSQPQIREKLRKLSLRKNSVFLIKKTCKGEDNSN